MRYVSGSRVITVWAILDRHQDARTQSGLIMAFIRVRQSMDVMTTSFTECHRLGSYAIDFRSYEAQKASRYHSYFGRQDRFHILRFLIV